MRPEETPFRTGWWGQGLGDARPDVSTYGLYRFEDLPPLPIELRGDFAWLATRPLHKAHVGRERHDENMAALPGAVAHAENLKLALPREFVKFFEAHDLQRRVRSCTDCFLDLTPGFVRSPLGDGYLLRFLADSQGCIFWYLYVRVGIDDHCVVATPDRYVDLTDPEPDPTSIVYCERSFESFMCRFWLENEIWYADYERRPVLPEGKLYLDRSSKDH